jgi:hypothetical protein
MSQFVGRKHTRELRIIFFVGAGISVKSHLPLGFPLTSHFMEVSLGKEAKDNLTLFWKKSLLACPDKLTKSYAEFPMRLEFVIGTVNAIDKEFSHENNQFQKDSNIEKYCRTPLVDGFSSFKDADPNENHCIIASFINKNAEFVTVNYDKCVEKALGEPIKTIIAKGVRSSECNGHILHHLHGIAGIDTNITIGATIKAVNNRIPEEFRAFLTAKLNNGYCIIFLGYSASDYFDIRILFETMEKTKSGSIIFVDHYHKENSDGKLDFVPKKTKIISECVQRLFYPFCRSNIFAFHCETTEFLMQLAKAYDLDIEYKQSCKKVPWKESFTEIAKTHNDSIYHFINCIRLSSQSGIPLSKIWPSPNELPALFDEIINDWINDSTDTINNMVASIMNDDQDLSQSIFSDIEDSCKKHISKDTLFKFEYALNSAPKNIRVTRQAAVDSELHQLPSLVDKAVRVLDMHKTGEKCIDKNSESIAVQSINKFASEHVKKWLGGNHSHKLLKNICFVREQINRLLEYKCNDFLYVGYYTSLLKRRNSIDAILSIIDANNAIDKEIIELSLEIACLSEVKRGYQSLVQKGSILVLNGDIRGIEYLKKYLPCYYAMKIE